LIERTLNLLIHFWFEFALQNYVSPFCIAAKRGRMSDKDFTGELFIPD
jgi:hypothetical protein